MAYYINPYILFLLISFCIRSLYIWDYTNAYHHTLLSYLFWHCRLFHLLWDNNNLQTHYLSISLLYLLCLLVKAYQLFHEYIKVISYLFSPFVLIFQQSCIKSLNLIIALAVSFPFGMIAHNTRAANYRKHVVLSLSPLPSTYSSNLSYRPYIILRSLAIYLFVSTCYSLLIHFLMQGGK